jgi:hypothetical protein
VGLKGEKKLKESQVWRNAQECFANVDKSTNVRNGVWVEVMSLEPIVIKKATKEGRDWDLESTWAKGLEV